MAVEGKKELLRQIPRVKLGLVTILTFIFTIVLLAAAHLTHSLTLRVEAYHALYNLLSLIGVLLTMKLSARPQSLHNTFGWARLEVLSMLTTLLFLSALCFSVAIESVQTAVHAAHQDAMHHPVSAMILGAVGLCLNAIVFFLIGGYTHHQGCFLEMRDSGSVWVGGQVTQESVQAGRRMLSNTDLRGGKSKPHPAVQITREILRDATGAALVLLCAAVVYKDDGGNVALYIDPALAVTSAALLMYLSYPYGKECGQILLQTIPGHIDVEAFQTRVMHQFPQIVNIHHLHIWTFTPSKVVATAHVVFSNTRIYLTTQPALKQFFNDEGITHVTIQPECMSSRGDSNPTPVCLLRCEPDMCRDRECCLYSSHPLLTSVSCGASTSGCKSTEENTGVRSRLLGYSCHGNEAKHNETELKEVKLGEVSEASEKLKLIKGNVGETLNGEEMNKNKNEYEMNKVDKDENEVNNMNKNEYEMNKVDNDEYEVNKNVSGENFEKAKEFGNEERKNVFESKLYGKSGKNIDEEMGMSEKDACQKNTHSNFGIGKFDKSLSSSDTKIFSNSEKTKNLCSEKPYTFSSVSNINRNLDQHSQKLQKDTKFSYTDQYTSQNSNNRQHTENSTTNSGNTDSQTNTEAKASNNEASNSNIDKNTGNSNANTGNSEVNTGNSEINTGNFDLNTDKTDTEIQEATEATELLSSSSERKYQSF